MTYEVSVEEIELVDQQFAQIDEYLRVLWDGKDVPVLDLAHCFLISIMKEYRHLKSGYETDTALEAWACRNLLELDVYTKYILSSETNARRFIGHIAIDGIEIFDSMKEWMKQVDPTVDSSGLDENLRLLHERKASEGIKDKRFLVMHQLADEVVMEADYRHASKLCSKLIHPTAWSVLSMSDEGEYAAFRVMMFHSGARYGLDAFYSIREYSEALAKESLT